MKLSNSRVGSLFIVIALGSLLLGLLFGVLGGLQYVFPDFLKVHLSFQKMRPLHVYLVINWIFCSATGAIYFFVPEYSCKQLFSSVLAKMHVALQAIILIIVVTGFFAGIFGGREYLEFPPWIIILIIAAWIVFMINFFVTVKPSFKHVPVYIWSWSTGLIFFLITIIEAQLWLLPFFNNNIIRDVTVQWKAMGSMVGSWNMLVYGSSMFVMERMTGDKTVNFSKKAFFFYFLGLTNLMFNWGHHTYIVPSSHVVQTISYVISMTELLILGEMIYSWRKKYLLLYKNKRPLPFRILTYAEVWIFVNLILSITISIPSVNFYTHGTHITVAHAMGATIGINTLLLLASLCLIASEIAEDVLKSKAFTRGIVLMNASLLIFWLSLIGMGICKISAVQQQNGFYEMMNKLLPYFKVFMVSGIFIVIGLLMMIVPLFKIFIRSSFQKEIRK